MADNLAHPLYLRNRRIDVRLATYNRRMSAVAQALAIPLVPLF